ncbi:D-Ala-D-Ala carboxypeptidase [Polaribacter pacificus]|uniref:D-Ala-D-Ala carboxypeptidase n=1 Tax=Polaribacter pacificus TaxID=1775173 RepID=A0A917MDU1_9FLAO|nr:serine hydrolase domain-containing protein [Polaribacter pacificus]GGG96772.1 D-Ala-D-Ala carboxypeptidase [Polaribacter pacificus]
MGTVSIFENGKETYQKSIGFMNVQSKKRANAATKFRIGSISKTFTAAVILQLMDEGKLQLSTLLEEYLPEIPNAHKITVEDLLRHQSGLVNITNNEDIRTWITKPQTRKQMLDRFVKNGTEFEPKEKSSYSNTNFILLSYIAEDIDQKPFANIIDSRIVKPLQLKRTEFGKPIKPTKNEALAYYFENNQWNFIDMQTNMSAPMGAGAIVSTATEVNIFYTNLFLGQLSSAASLKKLMTIEKGKGLGIMQFEFKGINVYGHDGGIDGFQSFALYIPEKKVTLAFTFNGLNAQLMPTVISLLETYFKGDPSMTIASISLKPEELDVYLGTYGGETFPAKVTFTKEDGFLFAQATGQPLFKLVASKKDSFIYDSMGVKFDFNQKNKTVDVTFGGKKHLLNKIE